MKTIAVIALTFVTCTVASDNTKNDRKNIIYDRRYASGYQPGDLYDRYNVAGDLYQAYRPYYPGQYASGYGYGVKGAEIKNNYNYFKRYASGYHQGDQYVGNLKEGKTNGDREYNRRYAGEFQQANHNDGFLNKKDDDLIQFYTLYYLVQYLRQLEFDDGKSNESRYSNNYYGNNIDESELNYINNEIDNTI